MNKYRNKKTIVDGIYFDSKKEACRYKELKLLEMSGLISKLDIQPRFILMDSFKKDGVTHRKIEYVGDFRYVEKGNIIVEDVKSPITRANPVYRIKKKLLLNKFRDINFIES